MKKLTEKEEAIMQVLWKLEKAFVKEVVHELPKPKPHYNTVSTLIRLMVDKGFVGFKAFGNTHQYYPLISKKEYAKRFMGEVLENYFDNSFKNLVAFFAEDKKLSADEISEIIDLIEQKKK